MRHCFPTARTWPLARFALRARVDATSVRALSLAPPASASEAQPAAAAAANSAATIAAADARSDGHGVDVRFGDGRASAFDAVWLRENCPSHQHSSGQRLFSVTDLLPGGGGGGGGGDAGARRRRCQGEKKRHGRQKGQLPRAAVDEDQHVPRQR